MSTTVSARNTAHAVLIALETAEKRLVPDGCHSRLFVAIEAARECVSYVSFASASGRTRLRLRLEDLQRVESNACLLDQLPIGSLHQRGLSAAIHITQCALAGVPPSRFVLVEAQWLYSWTGEEAA